MIHANSTWFIFFPWSDIHTIYLHVRFSTRFIYSTLIWFLHMIRFYLWFFTRLIDFHMWLLTYCMIHFHLSFFVHNSFILIHCRSDENHTRFILNEKWFTHNSNIWFFAHDSFIFTCDFFFFLTWDLKKNILHVIHLFSKCDSLQMIHLLSHDSLHMIHCYLHDNFTRFTYPQMWFFKHN